MTCRDDILAVARELSDARPSGTFSVQDVLEVLRARQTPYSDADIRRHISTFMCANAVGPHAAQFQDLERVSRGLYKLL
ncbi:hypothetical protein AUC44_02140 [Deinococcus actinosclerus]|uniref:DUF7669 domain-containing protein n=1 Tax=Deinococcus actinosclerus TaxID=1768108 RepID=A0ABN4K3J4_9DEIO|nr:hypothetical protein AUC44_02140 [Deinococcus actinosclerus]